MRAVSDPDYDTDRTKADLAALVSYIQSIVNTVREPLLVLNGQLLVTSASRTFYQTFRVSPKETLNQFLLRPRKRSMEHPRVIA